MLQYYFQYTIRFFEHEKINALIKFQLIGWKKVKVII